MNHPKDQFVLFVPYWIANVLDREKLNYNKLLDLTELRKILSTEELSILYWLNSDHPLFNTHASNIDRTPYDDPVLKGAWRCTQEDVEYVYSRLVPMRSIAKDAIASRLGAESDTVTADGQKYKIVTLSETKLVFVVIVYPGIDNQDLSSMSNALLKQLYAHTGYDDMARNYLFKGYIERLALANNAL